MNKLQQEVYECSSRWRAIDWDRKMGKSHLAINIAIREAITKPQATVAFLLPSRRMAHGSFRDTIDALPPQAINHTNRSELCIRLNSVMSNIRFYDYTDLCSLRGRSFDYVVFDESQDVDQVLWNCVIRPSITDTMTGVTLIGTHLPAWQWALVAGSKSPGTLWLNSSRYDNSRAKDLYE